MVSVGMRLTRGPLGIFAASCLLACGGQSASSSGNAGGDSGGASSGAGGSSSSKAPLPACLTKLFASCELEGVCIVEDVNHDGSQLRYCYTNAMRVVSDRADECGNRETKVYGSDRSLCYSLSVEAHAAEFCEGAITTWKDNAGRPVATVSTSSGPSMQITCAADGERISCPDGESCSWDTLPGPNCSVGACQ